MDKIKTQVMQTDKYYKFGYNTFGPLLWGYSHWLIDNLKKEGINKVYFFSRDGYIMLKAFNLIRGNEDFQKYYLEVSRRSLRVPILWKDCSIENLMTMLAPSNLISIKSIFDGIGLSIHNYKHLIEKYGFTEESVFYRNVMLQNEHLKRMLEELKNDITSNSKKEFDSLKKYLQQNNVYGKFAIVDIGWSGGMQRFLQTTLKELGIENEIHGYYTGVASFYKRNTTSNKLKLNGYLFDFSKNESDIDLRSSYVGLYELLFLETKGSVKKYYENESGQMLAERYPYEYSEEGKDMKEVQLISIVQKAALDFISNKEKENSDVPSKMELCSPLIKAGSYPTKEAISLFADFHFYDEGVYNLLAHPKSLLYYIFHPNSFKKDLYLSRWKTGFLYRLFKLPISYQMLYNLLKRYNN